VARVQSAVVEIVVVAMTVAVTAVVEIVAAIAVAVTAAVAVIVAAVAVATTAHVANQIVDHAQQSQSATTLFR
jgi:MFS superfamily sulfate permease-like transporter